MKKLFMILAVFSLISCLFPLVVLASMLVCGVPLTEASRTMAWLSGMVCGVYAAAYLHIE